MSVFQAVLIGILQGLTEFLPVSSSGHMILAGKIMDVEMSLGYELFMHLATLFAILIVMRKDVFSLIRRPLGKESRLIILATIPTAVVIFAFKGFFERSFDGSMLAYCFLITAILLLAAGLKNPIKKDSANINPTKKIGYFDALIIGTVQGFAALPGISRSGSTISTSVLLGNQKTDSARFSFLLSLPVIIGSCLLELPKGSLDVSPLPLFFGFTAAFFAGLLGLKFMLRLFKNTDIFALYLFSLSVFILLNDFWLGWF